MPSGALRSSDVAFLVMPKARLKSKGLPFGPPDCGVDFYLPPYCLLLSQCCFIIACIFLCILLLLIDFILIVTEGLIPAAFYLVKPCFGKALNK